MRTAGRAAAVLAAAALAAGCSTDTGRLAASPATGTSGPSGPPIASLELPPTPSTGATAFPSSSSAAAGTATASAPGAPVPAAALPSAFAPIGKIIRDPDLGHEIKVLRLARNLPWPPGQADESTSLELVGVEMTWTPGTTYTATLRTVDFSLGTGSAYPNRPDAVLGPSLLAAGWTLLPAELPTGQTATGWVVFRVEPKGSPTLRLDYTRPASRVTDDGQVFPKTVFSAQLAG